MKDTETTPMEESKASEWPKDPLKTIHEICHKHWRADAAKFSATEDFRQILTEIARETDVAIEGLAGVQDHAKKIERDLADEIKANVDLYEEIERLRKLPTRCPNCDAMNETMEKLRSENNLLRATARPIMCAATLRALLDACRDTVSGLSIPGEEEFRKNFSSEEDDAPEAIPLGPEHKEELEEFLSKNQECVWNHLDGPCSSPLVNASIREPDEALPGMMVKICKNHFEKATRRKE